MKKALRSRHGVAFVALVSWSLVLIHVVWGVKSYRRFHHHDARIERGAKAFLQTIDDRPSEWRKDSSAPHSERPSIGLPKRYRRLAKVLADAELRPILYDAASTSFQHWAHHGTLGAFLHREDLTLLQARGWSGHSLWSEGDWVLWSWEREGPEQSTLRVGEVIEHEYSRPYVYGPIEAALRLEERRTSRFSFLLAPGDYQFLVKAMAKPPGDIVIRLQSDQWDLRRRRPLSRVYVRPRRIAFTLQGLEAARVSIQIRAAKSETPSTLLIHGWELRRVR